MQCKRVEKSSGTWGRQRGHLHQQTMTRGCSRSEKFWLREYGDWGIGHAGKGSEAREMGQSASFFLAPSLWALFAWESSIIMLTEDADDLGMVRRDREETGISLVLPLPRQVMMTMFDLTFDSSH